MTDKKRGLAQACVVIGGCVGILAVGVTVAGQPLWVQVFVGAAAASAGVVGLAWLADYTTRGPLPGTRP